MEIKLAGLTEDCHETARSIRELPDSKAAGIEELHIAPKTPDGVDTRWMDNLNRQCHL